MPPLYCDLDGVLADHDAKMRDVYGSKWRSLYFHNNNTNSSKNTSTSLYDNTNDFFNTLPWMKDGKMLWEYIKVFNPTILTALPSSSTTSSSNDMYDHQKRQWCQRELGRDVRVITTNGPWNKYKVTSSLVVLLSLLTSSPLPSTLRVVSENTPSLLTID